MAKKMNKLPGVLSFQRCLLVTDGLFYNELDNGNLSPLWVMRHGIRGTQNINKASKEGQAASASAKRDEVSISRPRTAPNSTPMRRPCKCVSTCAAWTYKRHCSLAPPDRKTPWMT